MSDTREEVDKESCRSHMLLSPDILCLVANIGLPATAKRTTRNSQAARTVIPAPGQSPDACMV